jgi:hypothetical protein
MTTVTIARAGALDMTMMPPSLDMTVRHDGPAVADCDGATPYPKNRYRHHGRTQANPLLPILQRPAAMLPPHTRSCVIALSPGAMTALIEIPH